MQVACEHYPTPLHPLLEPFTAMIIFCTDDRAVRDSERKAAIMHFSTEQATQLTEHGKHSEAEELKETQPRVEHVKSLSKPAHGMYPR